MSYAGEVAELLSALIQNECVNDGTSGSESRSVATLRSYLGVDGDVVEPAQGRGNLIVRVAGTDSAAPPLLLLAHLDVVPVTPDGWSNDPFGGEHIDGFVWGRGAVDMLNVTAAMAAAFRRFLDGSVRRPEGDLIFAAVADEEAGSDFGVNWILENEPELLAADHVLCEIAYPRLPGPGGSYLPVQVAEKGPVWRKLRATGVPGHGSAPYGTSNALVPMADAISRLHAEKTPVAISDEWRAFATALDMDERLVTEELVDEAIEDIAADDLGWARYIHACTHLTLSPNILTAGEKTNVIPDLATAELDARVLPGQEVELVDDHLRKVFGPRREEIEIEEVMDLAANSSPASGPLWEAIGDAAERLTGSRLLVPTMTPATTDARFFRERGATAYGVGLFDEQVGFSEFLSMFHGNNERVSIGSLGMTAELLEHVISRFGDHARR